MIIETFKVILVMGTYMPGFQLFFMVFVHFVLVK